MDGVNATTLAQQVVKLGLVSPQQLRDCQDELGDSSGNGDALLRMLERKGLLTFLQIDKLLKGDPDGYFLGGYRLLYKIASGSFGRVFRADDPQSGRIVAVKVLRRRWSEDPTNVELFIREARVGMSLRQENIVEILSVGQDPVTRQHFIVMEFVEGGNLRDLLAIRKKFEPQETVRLLEDMVSGLAYAFSRGVTHRDIKLTNILISTQQAAKLVDFGLARTYASLNQTGEDDANVQRTVDYAGLEKATGVKFGDVRSDIFFLGCVAYEMLTSRPPLTPTRDKHARMHRYRFEHVPPIRAEEVKGPGAASLIQLVEMMMSLDPKLRYQTPAQVLDAVRKVRAEVGSGGNDGAAGKPAVPTVFVVERDERLQNPIRDRLKQLGYRVLLAGDPLRAVERFKQQPFAALIVDAGTTYEDGLRAFNHLHKQAREKAVPLHGILILSEDQQNLAPLVTTDPAAAVLVRPITLNQLMNKLQQILPLQEAPSNSSTKSGHPMPNP